jgi:hypothetical protein
MLGGYVNFNILVWIQYKGFFKFYIGYEHENPNIVVMDI